MIYLKQSIDSALDKINHESFNRSSLVRVFIYKDFDSSFAVLYKPRYIDGYYCTNINIHVKRGSKRKIMAYIKSCFYNEGDFISINKQYAIFIKKKKQLQISYIRDDDNGRRQELDRITTLISELMEYWKYEIYEIVLFVVEGRKVDEYIRSKYPIILNNKYTAEIVVYSGGYTDEEILIGYIMLLFGKNWIYNAIDHKSGIFRKKK